jgi:predicted HAD superfamily phosphohydrolase
VSKVVGYAAIIKGEVAATCISAVIRAGSIQVHLLEESVDVGLLDDEILCTGDSGGEVKTVSAVSFHSRCLADLEPLFITLD